MDLRSGPLYVIQGACRILIRLHSYCESDILRSGVEGKGWVEEVGRRSESWLSFLRYRLKSLDYLLDPDEV